MTERGIWTCVTYLDDVFMVKFGGLTLESSASCHLETEESTHWFLWGVSLLLAFLLLLRGSCDCWGGCGSLALLGGGLGWL
jgi:hypothetical protein